MASTEQTRLPAHDGVAIVSSRSLSTVQVPAEPATLQAKHVASQPVSQQTLSTQKPDVQSPAAEHAAPRDFRSGGGSFGRLVDSPVSWASAGESPSAPPSND